MGAGALTPFANGSKIRILFAKNVRENVRPSALRHRPSDVQSTVFDQEIDP
tara:strand:- start:3600 stop:3752 length:153 start_codon:yes stop_codon:yes gene_type:complete